jgi:hypothetical protein
MHERRLPQGGFIFGFVDMPSAQSRAEAGSPDKANFLALNDLSSCERPGPKKTLGANIRIMLEMYLFCS